MRSGQSGAVAGSGQRQSSRQRSGFGGLAIEFASAIGGQLQQLAQIGLLDQTVEAYQRSLTLTQKRYAGGVVSRADVLQVETQLQTAKAQAVDRQLQRCQ